MSKAAKLIIVVLFVLLAVSVFVVLTTFSQKTSLEESRKNIEEQLSQAEKRELKLLTDQKKMQIDLETAQAAKSKIQTELTNANTQLTGLTGQVTELTTDRDDWKARVDAVKKERDELMAKLEQTQTAQPLAQLVPTAPATDQLAAGASTTVLATPPAAVPMAGADQGEAYWADILRQKAGLELQLESLKAELSKGNLATEELKKKNSDLQMELASLTEEKTSIEGKIKYGEDLANNLSLELARSKNDRKFVNQHLEEARVENTSLRSQIKSLTTTKMSLEKGIAKLTEDKYAVEKKLAETENVIQARIDEVWQIKESLDKRFQEPKLATNEVELAPIVVSSPTTFIPQPGPNPGGESGLEGKVVSVNEDNNFVIVDLGQGSGVQLGDALNVYRGSKYIAGLEIIQVRKDISAADIKQKGDEIQVGDTVR